MATAISIFVFVIILKTLISAQCDFQTVTPYFQRSVYKFTLKFVKTVFQETKGQFIVSALTPWTLLIAMSHVSDTVLQEIREVLQLPLDRCTVHMYLQLMYEVTMRPDQPTSSTIEQCSTIFFNYSLNVNQSFFDLVSEGGIGNSRIMYFMYRNQTARNINYHVQRSTDDSILKVVSEEDLVNMTTIMVDALSFRGSWKIPFPYEDIETGAFFDDKDQQIGDVSMMYLSDTFNITSVSEIQATVLELPYYGEVNKFSMLIFLPKSNISLTTMLDSMENINISCIFDLYNRNGSTNVTVQIPRFTTISIYTKWRELLTGLGISTLFKQQEGNTSSISYYQLFLTNVIQQSKLEINEEGIEIGRATATLMQSRFMYEQFVANKPFLYMIVDRVLHVPIFTGAYSKPTIYKDKKYE